MDERVTDEDDARSLKKDGLRKVLEAEDGSPKSPLQPVTFKGRGLTPEFRHASWREIRDATHGERRP